MTQRTNSRNRTDLRGVLLDPVGRVDTGVHPLASSFPPARQSPPRIEIVIPAQAGIQTPLLVRFHGKWKHVDRPAATRVAHPDAAFLVGLFWIPACAGMTAKGEVGCGRCNKRLRPRIAHQSHRPPARPPPYPSPRTHCFVHSTDSSPISMMEELRKQSPSQAPSSCNRTPLSTCAAISPAESARFSPKSWK